VVSNAGSTEKNKTYAQPFPTRTEQFELFLKAVTEVHNFAQNTQRCNNNVIRFRIYRLLIIINPSTAPTFAYATMCHYIK